MVDLGGVLANVKGALNLVSKAKNLKLYEKLVDLQAAVVEMAEQNAELSAKNRELEAALDTKGKIRREGPFFYLEDDPDPLCPRCWEADQKVIHMLPSVDVPTGIFRECQQCGKQIIYPRHKENAPPLKTPSRRMLRS